VVTAREIQSMEGLKTWLGERLPSGKAALDAWGTQRGTKCFREPLDGACGRRGVSV